MSHIVYNVHVKVTEAYQCFMPCHSVNFSISPVEFIFTIIYLTLCSSYERLLLGQKTTFGQSQK